MILSEAYKYGYAAYSRMIMNLNVSCEYKEGTKEYIEWYAGYNDAFYDNSHDESYK